MAEKRTNEVTGVKDTDSQEIKKGAADEKTVKGTKTAETGKAAKEKKAEGTGKAAKEKKAEGTGKAAKGTKAAADGKTVKRKKTASRGSNKYMICLDVGGTKVLGVIFDSKDQVVYRLKKKSKGAGEGAGQIEEQIASVVDEMLVQAGISKKQIRGVAACAPGAIDQEKGIVLFTPNLPWRNYDMKAAMEKRLGLPFFVGNDVNLGVLGEHQYGAARGYKDVVGLFVGTGMGGGLILDGKLYSGHLFKGAEIGHMILEPEGPLCNCGQRGCLEAFSSKTGMTAYIRQQAGRGRESMMAPAVKNGVFRSSALKKAIAADDPVAMETVDRACHYLAVATGNLINIFSPQLVVYGGGVMEAVGDIFVEKILAEVDRYCFPSIRDTVEIKAAGLGDYSVVYGCLALLKEQLGKKS